MGVRYLAVTSGKGGVGKSVVALNLAIALGRLGARVLLVDADLGLGAAAVLLGISPPRSLQELLTGECSVAEAAVPGPEGIILLAAAADGEADFWLRPDLRVEVAEELRAFEAGFDYVVVDTGAGIPAATVDFVAAAGDVALIVTPEPTAIADAYAALKVFLALGAGVRARLLVNMAESPAEAADLHRRFAELVSRFLGAEIDNLGYIPLDRYVREAVRRQVPLVQGSPVPPAAAAIARIAGRLVAAEGSGAESGLFARALAQRQPAWESPT
jgi:flagellar biosynthesis protein FlhG